MLIYVLEILNIQFKYCEKKRIFLLFLADIKKEIREKSFALFQFCGRSPQFFSVRNKKAYRKIFLMDFVGIIEKVFKFFNFGFYSECILL